MKFGCRRGLTAGTAAIKRASGPVYRGRSLVCSLDLLLRWRDVPDAFERQAAGLREQDQVLGVLRDRVARHSIQRRVVLAGQGVQAPHVRGRRIRRHAERRGIPFGLDRALVRAAAQLSMHVGAGDEQGRLRDRNGVAMAGQARELPDAVKGSWRDSRRSGKGRQEGQGQDRAHA